MIHWDHCNAFFLWLPASRLRTRLRRDIVWFWHNIVRRTASVDDDDDDDDKVGVTQQERGSADTMLTWRSVYTYSVRTSIHCSGRWQSAMFQQQQQHGERGRCNRATSSSETLCLCVEKRRKPPSHTAVSHINHISVTSPVSIAIIVS